MGRKGKKNRRSNNRNDRRSLEGFSKTDFQQESETMKEELNSVKDTIEEIKVAVETPAATSANTEVLKDDLMSLDHPVKEECNTILEKVLVDENVLDVPKCLPYHSSLQTGVMTNTFQEDAYKKSSCKQFEKESEDYLRKWSAMKDIFEPLTKSNILSQYNEKINSSVEKCPEIPVTVAKDWPISSNVCEAIYKSSESVPQVYPTLLKDVSDDCPLQTKTSTEFYPTLIEDNINKDSTVSPITVIDHNSVLSENAADDCSVLPKKVVVCQASSKAIKQDYVSLLEVDSEVCTELSKTIIEAVDKNPLTSAETVRLSPHTSLEAIQENCSVSTETLIKNYPLPPGSNADEFFISTETVTEMCPTPFETVIADNPVPEKPLSLDITEECTELLETVIEDCCASFKTDTEQYNATPETVTEICSHSLEIVNKDQTTVPEYVSKKNPILPEATQEDSKLSSETFIADCSASLEAAANDCTVTYETIEDISLSHDDDTQIIPALDQVVSFKDIKEDCSVSREANVEESPTSSVTDVEIQGHNQMSFLTQPDVISQDTTASSEDATNEMQSLAEDAYPVELESFIGDADHTASIYDASSAEPSATIDDTLSAELTSIDDAPFAELIASIDVAPRSEHVNIDNVTSAKLAVSNNDFPCAELTATKDYASCSELNESKDNTPSAEMKEFKDIPFKKSIFSKACSLSEKLQTVNLGVMEPPKVCLTASDCSNSLEFYSTIALKGLHISNTNSSEALKLSVGSSSQQLPHEDYLSLKSKNSESKKSQKYGLLKNANGIQSVFENIFIMSLLVLIWLPLRIFLCFNGI